MKTKVIIREQYKVACKAFKFILYRDIDYTQYVHIYVHARTHTYAHTNIHDVFFPVNLN